MIQNSPAFRPVADTDVFLIGLRRSGIHAIVSWLIPHLSGLTRFVNDPEFEPDAGEPLAGRPNRYYFSKGGRSTEVVMAGALREVSENITLDDTGAYLGRLNPLGKLITRNVLKGFKKFRRANPLRAPLIPYAFEDAESLEADYNLFVVENVTPSEFARVYPRWRENVYVPWLAKRGLSPARRVRVVMTMREPWNQLASLLKNPPMKPPRIITPEAYRAHWLDYALEVSGGQNLLGQFGEVLPISYPRWFNDPSYRAELASVLGAQPTDFGLDVVSDFGGGSSFDGQAMLGRAQQMKVGERWKAYADHPLMKDLCGDAQVNELSRRIFGTESPLAMEAKK
jgi:hypothetical protein